MVGLINPAATAMLTQLGPSPDRLTNFVLPVGCEPPLVLPYIS